MFCRFRDWNNSRIQVYATEPASGTVRTRPGRHNSDRGQQDGEVDTRPVELEVLRALVVARGAQCTSS